MGIYGLKSVLKVPTQIIFGDNALDDLGEYVKKYGKRVLLIYGGKSIFNSGNYERITSILKNEGFELHEFGGITHDPDEDLVQKATENVLLVNPEIIIGIGGGSVIDTAKAVSVLATNGGTVSDYWAGKKFTKPSIPMIAVPTTSGTGAEVTKNAVISNREKTYKKSIRTDFMTPDVAIIDPILTISVPRQVTIDTGLDALIQNLEAFTSTNAGPITDTLALKGIELGSKYIPVAAENPENLEAREALSLCSLFGGITLGNAGLGLAHGLSHPIGIKYNIPHGRACAIVMSKVIEYNYPARKEKYDTVARLFGEDGDPATTFRKFLDKLGISNRLRDYGIKKEDFPMIVKYSKGGSRNFNPVPHSDETVLKMLEEMY